MSDRQRGDSQDPEVRWVNPDLPEGQGLAHHTLASRSMGHDVGYVVRTPPGFAPDVTYPTIYFLHGMGGNESADAAGFSRLLDRGIADGRLPASICIFPNGGRSGYRGGVDRMIVDELVPLIDREYPTTGSRDGRVVAGFSMGGAGSVRLSLENPDLFCAAGSWGGDMFRDPQRYLDAVDRNGARLKDMGYSVLLVNGEQDRPGAFATLVERFEHAGIDYHSIVLPDTPHNLGLYYERGGDAMIDFLGAALT